MIPLLIMVFMCYASMKTGWFFSVDEYGIYTRGKLWSLQAIVNYCYFVFTTVYAFLVASKEPSSIQRRQYTAKDAMEREAKNLNLPYELKLDFGYTKVDSPAGKTSAIITEADHQMHNNKNSN